MNPFRLTIFAIILFFCSGGCFVIDNQYSGLPPGRWRGVLQIATTPVSSNPKAQPLPEKVNLRFDEVTEGELPFLFDVVYDSPEQFHIEIINGEERIRVDDISMGVDRQTAKDTLLIRFPEFDSYIRARYEQNVIQGEWVVNYRENYRIPFVARFGKDYRFTNLRKKPAMDLSGRWEATFGLVEGETPYPAIGEFKQDGNQLSGTFLTTTGDYRFLEGTIQADKLYLSVFDGSHAFLFEGKVRPDSTIVGSFRSGTHYLTLWEARRNPNAELPDANQLTQLKEGFETLEFSFENPDGRMVSPTSEAYRGKVKLIQIMGTWCPNCRDETNFLIDYLRQNPGADIAVIALAFERYREREQAMKALRTYRERMALPYEVLLAGYHDKKEAGEVLPMLSEVQAYPTLIFLDRENRVRRIHTGFSGPATSEYPAFSKEFDAFVKKLLAERDIQ